MAVLEFNEIVQNAKYDVESFNEDGFESFAGKSMDVESDDFKKLPETNAYKIAIGVGSTLKEKLDKIIEFIESHAGKVDVEDLSQKLDSAIERLDVTEALAEKVDESLNNLKITDVDGTEKVIERIVSEAPYKKDENGEILRDEDGKPILNTETVENLKEAIIKVIENDSAVANAFAQFAADQPVIPIPVEP